MDIAISPVIESFVYGLTKSLRNLDKCADTLFTIRLPFVTIIVNLIHQPFFMTRIVIDKKKYVLIPEKEYEALQLKAARKMKPEKTLSIEDARNYSKKLIRKWASEKSK